MADYLHSFHRKLPLTNLKFIIYENDQHQSANNISNDIVRPVFTTNINGTG
jgi:hypothetical protein